MKRNHIIYLGNCDAGAVVDAVEGEAPLAAAPTPLPAPPCIAAMMAGFCCATDAAEEDGAAPEGGVDAEPEAGRPPPPAEPAVVQAPLPGVDVAPGREGADDAEADAVVEGGAVEEEDGAVDGVVDVETALAGAEKEEIGEFHEIR